MMLGEISEFALSALGISAFLLNFLYLAIIVRRQVAGLSRVMYFVYFPALLLCTAFMLSVNEVCRYILGGREPSIFEQSAEQLSAYLCLGFLAVMTLLWGIMWLRQELVIMSSLTPQSLEYGLNSLPDGVAFVDTKGVPLLVNDAMQKVCRTALGKPLLDSRELEDSLQRGHVAEGCRAEVRGKGYYLHLKDGSVRDIQKRLLMIDGRKIWELVAYDVTERYRKRLELEERSTHLKEVNRNIRAYTRELNAIIREEEVLAAKIRIHDDVGRALLSLKSYLIRGGDRDTLIELWRFTAGILRGENEPDESADPIGALREAADAVGVKLNLVGDIPNELRSLIAIAIHECLTNTVKHADGSELTVTITEQGGVTEATFTNDGKPPEGEVSEKGGLKSLRTAVEKLRGEMELSSAPRFMLTIRVSGKDQTTADFSDKNARL